MGTSSSEVLDLFMSRVDDYRLTSIFETSGSMVLNIYLEPFLLDSIDEFSPICNQDLTFTTTSGSVEGYFSENLSWKNKLLLSKIATKSWLTKTINNILQMNVNLLDHDFKTFSQAQNLKAKQDYLMTLKEEISQSLMDYSYANNDWTKWRNQTFI